MPDLATMTQATWDMLTSAERDALRDLSDLTPQLTGLEGWRVEVTDQPGDKPRRFIVGRSTGWRPCHLEISRRGALGGMAANQHYATVRQLYKAK